MAKIFGEESELPKPVTGVSDLTAPVIDRGEYIDYEPVKNGGDAFNLEEMLSDNIDESLRKMEEETEVDPGEGIKAEHIPGDDTTTGAGGENIFGIDDLDAEMVADMWNDLRVSTHSGIYNWAVYKEPKKAKALARQLSMKDHKTEAEKALLEQLWGYVDEHDGLRKEYLEAVPYSEKHQALMVRFVEYQINRMRLSGKTFPRWIMWVYLFVVPEIQMGIKFAKISSEMPQFNFDFEQFQRQQNAAKK